MGRCKRGLHLVAVSLKRGEEKNKFAIAFYLNTTVKRGLTTAPESRPPANNAHHFGVPFSIFIA